MTSETNGHLDRRQFLSLTAAAGATVFAAPGAEYTAGGLRHSAAAKGVMPILLTPKPLPEKVYNTTGVGISRTTHDEHYELYRGSVVKVNAIRTKLAELDLPDSVQADQTYGEHRELKAEYNAAIGSVRNHELYFDHIGGKGGVPEGPVADVIKTAFGSYDRWKADLKATGLAAKGWVWLAYDPSDGSLFNYLGDSPNTFPLWHTTPLLALDVYEHAYYLDFGRDRARYIEAFLHVIDWDAVNANLKLAQALGDAAQAVRG